VRANGWRYQVITRGPERDEARTIDVIRDGLVAADEPERVVEPAQRRGAGGAARPPRERPFPVHDGRPHRAAADDPLTVVAEPFSQWVIEDFPDPRPEWPGVQFVADTRPFELMKLRLPIRRWPRSGSRRGTGPWPRRSPTPSSRRLIAQATAGGRR